MVLIMRENVIREQQYTCQLFESLIFILKVDGIDSPIRNSNYKRSYIWTSFSRIGSIYFTLYSYRIYVSWGVMTHIFPPCVWNWPLGVSRREIKVFVGPRSWESWKILSLKIRFYSHTGVLSVSEKVSVQTKISRIIYMKVKKQMK